MKNVKVLILLLTGVLLLTVWLGKTMAHGPDPSGTIVLKGILVSVDANKGVVTVKDKKGKNYAVRAVEGSSVHICDTYGCHIGKGSAALKGYKYTFPSGVPTVVDFDPKTGEALMLHIIIDSGHYLDTELGGMDTEE